MESDKVLEFYERRILLLLLLSSQVRFWGGGKEEEEQQQSYFGEFERFRKDSQGSQKRFSQKAPKCFLFVFKDSESLNLLRHNDGVVLADRLTLHRLVVERAVVFPEGRN